MKNNSLNNKVSYILIFIGLIYSITISIVDTKKFDQHRINSIGNQIHPIIRTDVSQYWNSAHDFKVDIESGKNFFKSGEEHRSIYLYPKLIALYFLAINKDIKNSENQFVLNNYKYGIPIIQSLIFYSLLILLLKRLNHLFAPRVVILIIGFLALEPTLIQYHSSYWTESLYFSFLILILFFLLKVKKDLSYNFLIGLLIGLSILQRNVSMYLIIPIIVYLLLVFRKKSFLPIVSCIIGYSLIIFFLGYIKSV